jgi:hypothetical protein
MADSFSGDGLRAGGDLWGWLKGLLNGLGYQKLACLAQPACAHSGRSKIEADPDWLFVAFLFPYSWLAGTGNCSQVGAGYDHNLKILTFEEYYPIGIILICRYCNRLW